MDLRQKEQQIFSYHQFLEHLVLSIEEKYILFRVDSKYNHLQFKNLIESLVRGLFTPLLYNILHLTQISYPHLSRGSFFY